MEQLVVELMEVQDQQMEMEELVLQLQFQDHLQLMLAEVAVEMD